ncbi:MAG: MATE family efflux transporter [Ruminiclostridium sp.]|nr:MATE family efflux transporter [Ruminiclostridium sp.]MBQ9851520.1 MATE family efflux transporter [Ruminiclostridium sp.]MBQ9932635.1 MATE family efflux transporter [Ruminiclostridium sp.]
MKKNVLIEGRILTALLRFSLPVLFALFLQALYGGIDLLIVGRFAETADVSGVATGSMFLQTLTAVITGLAMGITIFVGYSIGEKDREKTSRGIGTGLFLFLVIGVVLTLVITVCSGDLARLMKAPEHAFRQTDQYIMICGMGMVFVVAYNVLSGIFRGLGDSKTPLLTVAIACVVNILGDLLLVKGFGLGAAGAALATVFAQGISVVVSVLIIRRQELPFDFGLRYIRFDARIAKKELQLGLPIGFQEFLVGLSFVVIQVIVNMIGVVESAGVGVAEKITVFIMLVPSAYMQAMSAFVAQNIGAGKPERADRALLYGCGSSVAIGIVMGYVAFFHGNLLAGLFTEDAAVVAAAHDYLKGYAIDCLLVGFLFCFIGYFNGREKTLFVMVQGLVGALCVRIPIVYAMSLMEGATLFHISLGTPSASVVQIILCVTMLVRMKRARK